MKAIYYATKNQRKLQTYARANKYMLLQIRQAAKELRMAVSSVHYQFRQMVKKGLLVTRAGKYLVRRIAKGILATTFARLSRHERTLNGPHIQVKRGPGRPRKIPLEAV